MRRAPRTAAAGRAGWRGRQGPTRASAPWSGEGCALILPPRRATFRIGVCRRGNSGPSTSPPDLTRWKLSRRYTASALTWQRGTRCAFRAGLPERAVFGVDARRRGQRSTATPPSTTRPPLGASASPPFSPTRPRWTRPSATTSVAATPTARARCAALTSSPAWIAGARTGLQPWTLQSRRSRAPWRTRCARPSGSPWGVRPLPRPAPLPCLR